MDDFSSITPEERILIQSLIDGSIDPSEASKLNELLRNNPLLRAFYIDQMRIDSHLRDYHTTVQPLVLVGRHDPDKNRRKIISIAAGSLAAGIAAAVAFMMMVPKEPAPSSNLPQYSQFKATPNPMPIARITGIDGVNWSESTGNLSYGTWLAAGKLDIKDGLIEITYDSGTSVILKGPSVYYIEENNRGFLESGTLRATTPGNVARFTIETPNTKLLDYGTTYGVTASNDNSTSIHVLKGRVRAQSSGADAPQWRTLYAGDAIEIAQGLESPATYTNFEADMSQFDWAPQRKHVRDTPLKYLHYGFENFDGTRFPETGTGFSGQHFPAEIREFSKEKSTNRWTSNGKIGQALELNAANRFLETSFKGIGGNQARTIACWVKYDRPRTSGTKKSYGAIAAWGEPERGKLWKMALRPTPSIKNAVTVRTEAGWGNTGGSTPLNDGQWHHVVSVFTGGPNADAGSNVLHYVDGSLEKRTNIMSRLVETTAEEGKFFPLTIGLSPEVPFPKSIQSLVKASENKGQELPTFKGLIDELYIFNDALTPEEIRQLYKNNTVPQ
ncbi:LamG-like jellyroll fold domain-containing protein [Rubritalea tangerina]|uniref:LamG-like jellyroll fold domain-containing protein n=1 Tax=Rubritalea tangerina TaxID=430798 RepID=A0ABW4Z6G3_9BACT